MKKKLSQTMTKEKFLNALKESRLELDSQVEIRVGKHPQSGLLTSYILLTTKHKEGRFKGQPKQEYLGGVKMEFI